ncbi:C40 family peptidase [Blautia wexlerae]|uniref:C40 family peptidase n=1 Tax=Blautia wexlerae TaxID=418240 RepID=UPI00042588CA|nr:NlpC/P60 family protein [Blautia wexlerae]
MKNKYLTRFLCLTLMSGMALSGPASVLAAEDTAAYTADGSDFSDSGDFDSGSEDPAPADPTPAEPTPAPADPTPTPADPTPTPTDPTPTPTDPTPTPANPTPTPSSQITKAAQDVIDRIKELNAQTITLEKKATVQSIRTAYNALSDTEKAQVSNYNLLVQAEATIAQLEAQKNNANTNNPFTDNTSAAQTGTPVYYASNIHAGKDFYLDSLKNNYNLTFSDDFASVMDEIEKEYKEKNKVADASDVNGSKTTTSADSLLVRNWQDILAVYVYQQSQDGKTEFTLDSSCKKDLAKIFAELNPIVRDKQDITHVAYANRKINYYIKKNKIAKKDRTILKKYVETDCKLLCAVVTAANGFVRESVGDDVSEERVNVISAAYSLVGKVGYFWGGKSTVIGEDPGWGTSEKVSAEGSKSTGTIRAYGLDCSGFVTWAVINGYQDKAMQEAVGDGTSDQWEKANVVTEADAQPGDLVFQKGPEAGSDNHVGILCGKTDAGDWIAVHCSSGKNGVTVGEAYSASFRYIRQPSFYPTQEQVQEMQSNSTVSITTDDAAASTGTDIFSANVTVSNTLQDAMKSNTSDSTGFTTSESTEKTSILPDKIDLSKEKVAVFKAK